MGNVELRPHETPFLDRPGVRAGVALGAAGVAAGVADAIHTGNRVDALLAQDNLLGARNEMAYLVCLDGKNKLLTYRMLGEGITDSVLITARKVLEVALACNASRVALAHNHISGIAMYSAADVAATREVAKLLRQVDIELMDHYIIANDDMVSMRESGVFETF